MHANLVIYYVDDDPEDLDVLAEIGISMGIEVVPIHESEEMRSKINHSKQGPKVIFLDVNMPIRSGYDWLEALKHPENANRLPVVTFSTGHDVATVEKCWQLGADMYIRKGNSLARYQEILRQVKAIDWQSFERSEENFVLTLTA